MSHAEPQDEPVELVVDTAELAESSGGVAFVAFTSVTACVWSWFTALAAETGPAGRRPG